MNTHIDPPHAGAVLDEMHVGNIHGAFGTILHQDHGPRQNWRHRLQTLLAILGPGLIVMVGDNDAGRLWHLHSGRPELRRHSAVDAAAARPRALREPGDGAAPRRGRRRRPCAADPGALWQVLGRLFRHRPVPAQRVDRRHRIHRHRPGAELSRRLQAAGRVPRRAADHGGGEHRRFPPLRALLHGAGRRQPAAGPGFPGDPSADGPVGARFRHAATA
ncbi:hypothetical protein SAMN06265338_1285 [Rhodoblastus acidophilus]|uniref:Uncharacterized protein n=1 Tax=Rhodoblastus acidophilus TaxID=1074 RepID=A0A212SDD0_RHOAC|nr:hypothetical protein SAMN06265338_1285 [Rhodoblastus acidophilus]